MKKLPPNLYAMIEQPENGDSYLVCESDLTQIGLGIGESRKIGFYKLIGTYDAEGIIEMGEIEPV